MQLSAGSKKEVKMNFIIMIIAGVVFLTASDEALNYFFN